MNERELSPTRIIAIIILGSAFVCGLVTYLLILESCFFLNYVEERSFNALDLEIPSDLFPAGANVTPIHRPSESQGAFESASMSFFWQLGNRLAGYDVWRFRKEEEASRTFLAESGGSFYNENIYDFYNSSIADEFAVGCGFRRHFGYKCNMAARYEEYVVNLHSIIDREMTLEMFNEAVIFIDEQMVHHLYEE
ncbi:hypothetical protein [Candidatus Leptofilum sp.]|uniref:hypothetical protein n=1 Tax=Candidatus Leptofilum sp. TaxID=3241576 RepID=UPI003B5C4FC2